MRHIPLVRCGILAGFLVWQSCPPLLALTASDGFGPADLMPALPGWAASEEVRTYMPESLFEYINGAAESYLGYDFLELAVGQFKQEDDRGSLTVEIYDMGQPRNAFGIYSVERYPESRFLKVGVQGYMEEGALNFFAGRYYVKLMCYDCGQETESTLRSAATALADRIVEGLGFPEVLSAFPEDGLVANSQKFILRNFMGLSFLEAGYTAQYRRKAGAFEAFIVEARSGEEAEAQLRLLLDRAGTAAGGVPDFEGAYHWRDKYLGHIFVIRADRFLCGLTRVSDDMSAAVGNDLAFFIQALKPLIR